MAVAVTVGIPDGTEQKYERVIATVFPDGKLPEGWLAHLTGPTECVRGRGDTGADRARVPPVLRLRPPARDKKGIRPAMTLREHLRALGVELDPVLEQLGLPTYLIDAAGIIRWHNAAAVALSGNSLGRPFSSCVAPEYRRRLRVAWPSYLATHSTEQMLYLDDDGLLGRHDYDVESSGGTSAAHYVSDYDEVAGIRLPTKHRIFPRTPDGQSLAEPLVASIDLSEIAFT